MNPQVSAAAGDGKGQAFNFVWGKSGYYAGQCFGEL
jgi:hypothetical protein